jgi:hypothetical protein
MKHAQVHKLALMAMLLGPRRRFGRGRLLHSFSLRPGRQTRLSQHRDPWSFSMNWGSGRAPSSIWAGSSSSVSSRAGLAKWVSLCRSAGRWRRLADDDSIEILARKMTIIGVSACASITHGFAQVAVYCLFVQNVTAFYYYPLMSLDWHRHWHLDRHLGSKGSLRRR